MWVKLTDGSYANLDQSVYVTVDQDAGTFYAQVNGAGNTKRISGIAEATSADASAKIKKLVSGVEASNVG